MLEAGAETELATKCALVLLRVHQKVIVSNEALVHTLLALQSNMRTRLRESKVHTLAGRHAPPPAPLALTVPSHAHTRTGPHGVQHGGAAVPEAADWQ